MHCTGTQTCNVSCAVCEQASWDDGYDSEDAVELAEWQQESDAEYGDVAWAGDVDEPVTGFCYEFFEYIYVLSTRLFQYCIRGKKTARRIG